MKTLYEYMVEKLHELYTSDSQTVALDMEHFFRLYKMVCDMMQVRNIIRQDEDVEKLLKQTKEG